MNRKLVTFKIIDKRIDWEYNASILHHGLDDLWSNVKGVILTSQHEKDVIKQFYDYCKNKNYDYNSIHPIHTELILYNLDESVKTVLKDFKLDNAYTEIKYHLKQEYFNKKQVIS